MPRMHCMTIVAAAVHIYTLQVFLHHSTLSTVWILFRLKQKSKATHKAGKLLFPDSLCNAEVDNNYQYTMT